MPRFFRIPNSILDKSDGGDAIPAIFQGMLPYLYPGYGPGISRILYETFFRFSMSHASQMQAS
jgi:hypothetical protein